MSKFQHVFEWLNVSEAIEYLRKGGVVLTSLELVSVYSAFGYQLLLECAEPPIYFIPKIPGGGFERLKIIGEGTVSYRSRARLSVMNNGENREYSLDDEIWVEDKDFENNSELNTSRPAYLRFNAVVPAEHYGMEECLEIIGDENVDVFYKLTWGVLLSDVPKLLLFKRINLDALMRAIKESSELKSVNLPPERSLGARERNTLLVVIAALCKEASIDYKQKGIAVAIENMTERLGAPVTDDTILKILKQIDQALESRRK